MRNIIWSYFLLVAYALVFGHQIIPHHHHDQNNYHTQHVNGEMDHCVSEKETHHHIAHKNHFDEGIIGYISCLVGQGEQLPQTECQWENIVDTRSETDQNKKNAANDVLMGEFLSQEELADSHQVEPLRVDEKTTNQVVDHGVNRGPPFTFI